jgi:hypothetical protein
MYYEQLGNEEHSYRLKFSDGTTHRGVTPSGIHFCLVILFFEQHVKEEVFADRLRERSQALNIPIDDLIEDEIELYDDYRWQSDEYYSALFNRNDFIMWMYAREKLLDHDEAKIPAGSA